VTAALVRALFEAAEAWNPLDRELGGFPRNDLGNARRLIKRFGDRLLYVQEFGWFWWCGTHWSLEHGFREVQRCAHETVRLLRAELRWMIDEGPREDETKVQFGERCEKFAGWCRSSGDRSRINGMIEVAAPDLTVPRERLDADPFLFNVRNGTLVLRRKPPEGEDMVVLKPHDPKDLITMCAGVTYDPEATCPRFQAFLQRFLPDRKTDADNRHIEPFDEIRAFVQRAIGYTLTGDIGEQCLFLLHGGGANGKSTLMGVLRGVLDQYASSIPIEVLLAQDKFRTGSEAQPEIARLPGKRVAISSEPEPGSRLSAKSIKKFTGGEPIPTRQLNKPVFEFVPAFKLWVSFNDLPPVRAQDHGMWRRIYLIEFAVRIDKSEVVPNYERILLEEASGILNWALDGFRIWAERGLAVPPIVLRYTEEYRQEFDRLAGFVDDVLIKQDGGRISGSEMRHAYEAWCKANGDEAMSPQALGHELRKRGIHKLRSNGVYYAGYAVAEQWKKQGELKTQG